MSMKRITIIVSVLLLNAFASCGQTESNTIIVVYTIDLKYMRGCEMGTADCKTVVLKRSSLQDSVRLIFPAGGTLSDVFLYTEAGFIKWLKKKPKGQPKYLRHDRKFAGQGNPTLDLTGLPDRVYRPHMVSCGVGGTFRLTIATEK